MDSVKKTSIVRLRSLVVVLDWSWLQLKSSDGDMRTASLMRIFAEHVKETTTRFNDPLEMLVFTERHNTVVCHALIIDRLDEMRSTQISGKILSACLMRSDILRFLEKTNVLESRDTADHEDLLRSAQRRHLPITMLAQVINEIRWCYGSRMIENKVLFHLAVGIVLKIASSSSTSIYSSWKRKSPSRDKWILSRI